MIFRLTVSVRSLDWWSQGSTMHTTTWETTMLMCSRRKLQTRCLFRLQSELTPPLPDRWEPAWDPVGDNRLKEAFHKYRVSKPDCPAALWWYTTHGLPRCFARFNIFVTIQASGDRGTKARFDLSMTKSPLPVPLLSFTRRFTGLAFLYCTAFL